MNNVAVNMGVQNLFKCLLSFLLGVYPEVELLGHLVILCLIFQGITILVSTAAAYIYFILYITQYVVTI